MLKLLTQQAGFSNIWGMFTFGLINHYRFVILNKKGSIWLGHWNKRQYKEMDERQMTVPVEIGYDEEKTYWVFQNQFYWTREELSADDVKVLLLDIERRRKRTIERARSMMDIEHPENIGRAPIPDDVKLFVWRRDGGKCVKCGSNKNLEFDHIIPLSMGGSNTARNIQLLCEEHNREKGGNLI